MTPVGNILRGVILVPLVLVGAWAQEKGGARPGKLKLSFEQRGRYEDRNGNAFGKAPDVATGLFRTRLGLTYTPVPWLKLSGMVQDSRAPWYGPNAPNAVRDQADLHESYVELFPSSKQGFGMTAGRMMLNYGEGRLIGAPRWGNLARTYDSARVYFRSPRARFEVLLVSPVKVRIGEFNRPVPGDRVWGTYNSFPGFYADNLLEAYVLRRDQNRPGGFAGAGTVAVNTFGFRLAGPLASGIRHSVEAALQKGKAGAADLSAFAWFAGLSRRWTIRGKTLDLSAEYKYASGAFDQLYPANHDKFGHEDLFGWRNIHNTRAVAALALTKNLSVNVMYDSSWLANLKEGIYNGAGKLIARSATGTAGRHVGQEADVFGTYKYNHFTFGAGYGHFFAGRFIRNATPGIGPTYLYVFHSYSL